VQGWCLRAVGHSKFPYARAPITRRVGSALHALWRPQLGFDHELPQALGAYPDIVDQAKLFIGEGRPKVRIVGANQFDGTLRERAVEPVTGGLAAMPADDSRWALLTETTVNAAELPLAGAQNDGGLGLADAAVLEALHRLETADFLGA